MAISLLLADDSPTIAKILSLALASEQYEIRAVLTAEEALKELKANPPFFFLCDLSLPAKNGYEFARLIKSDSKLAKIRVVLLASAFEPVDEQMFQGCGADGLVKKPFDPSELRSKLRQIHDMPAKQESSRVTGSLSGFMVATPDPTPVDLSSGEELGAMDLSNSAPLSAEPAGDDGLSLPAGGAEEVTDLSHLLTGNAGEGGNGDADAILAGLLGGGNEPESASPAALSLGSERPPAAPPAAPPASPPKMAPPKAAPNATFPDQPSLPTNPSQPTFTNTTVLLDLSGSEMEPKSHEAPQGIAASFSTPPGGTATIDLSLFGGTESLTPPPAPGASGPAEEPLSANAQALAAFFAAEIQSKGPETPPAASAPPAFNPAPKSAVPAQSISPGPGDDDFESSIGSIEWGDTASPAKESLNAWSSSQPAAPSAPPRAAPSAPPRAAAPDTPPPAPKRSAPPASAPQGSGASADMGGMMFDTGHSTFRFSEDYVNRITKSFTGAHNEEVPTKHTPVFEQKSDDSAPASAGPSASGFSGGSWNAADMQRIEQIVREEVQMVVREVAEKIAWEVIPELAENIIRKELDKVLKEMEPG